MEEREDALTRSQALARGALAVGAAYGLGAIAPFVSRALAAEGGGDVHTLNFLLPFEYLQVKIYDRANRGVNDKGQRFKMSPQRKDLVKTLLEEERQHVAALSAMIEKLGGRPVAEGNNYAFAYRGASVLLGLADELEQSAISAYNGVIPSIQSKEAKELAGSIVQVEGRHLANIQIERKREPAPEAFDPGRTEYQADLSTEKFTGVY